MSNDPEQPPKLTPTYEEPDILTPEEEKLLDRIWHERAAKWVPPPPMPPAPSPVDTPLPTVSLTHYATLECSGGNDATGEITQLQLSLDGTLLAVDDFDTIGWWNLFPKPTMLARIEEAQGAGTFFPDSQIVALLGQQQTIQLFSRQGVPLRSFGPYHDEIYDRGKILIFSNGELLVTLATDQSEGIIWSTQGEVVAVLAGIHQHPLVDACFSPDTRFCATLDKSGMLCLWDTTTWRPVIPGTTVPEVLNGRHLQFSVDGTHLAFSSTVKETRLVLWHLEELLAGKAPVLFGRENTYQCMVGGKLLADVGISKIHWYDLATRTYLGTFTTSDRSSLVSHPSSPWPIPMTLSPDGKYAAIGSTEDGKLWIWDLAHQQVLACQPVYANTQGYRIGISSHVFYSLLWHPEGNLLIMAGEEPGEGPKERLPMRDTIIRSVKLWKIAINE